MHYLQHRPVCALRADTSTSRRRSTDLPAATRRTLANVVQLLVLAVVLAATATAVVAIALRTGAVS